MSTKRDNYGRSDQSKLQQQDINANRYRRPSLLQMKATVNVAPEERIEMEDVANYVADKAQDTEFLLPALPFGFAVRLEENETYTEVGVLIRETTFEVAYGSEAVEEVLGTITVVRKGDIPVDGFGATERAASDLTTTAIKFDPAE